MNGKNTVTGAVVFAVALNAWGAEITTETINKRNGQFAQTHECQSRRLQEEAHAGQKQRVPRLVSSEPDPVDRERSLADKARGERPVHSVERGPREKQQCQSDCERQREPDETPTNHYLTTL